MALLLLVDPIGAMHHIGKADLLINLLDMSIGIANTQAVDNMALVRQHDAT